MNIAKCAQTTAIMNNVKSGHYIRGAKWMGFGSVIEDSLFAQQREADRRLKAIKLQRELKLAKRVA
ncbi:hypothetical protein EB169_08340 [archaeon]|nr:hypothetical protein [archaeon]